MGIFGKKKHLPFLLQDVVYFGAIVAFWCSTTDMEEFSMGLYLRTSTSDEYILNAPIGEKMEFGSFVEEELLEAERHGVLLNDCLSDEIRASKEVFILNVGGTKFHVLKSNFATWPTTRLSRLARAKTEQDILKLCDGYVKTGGSKRRQMEFFFNRNWTSFNSILDIYRCGQLHELTHACAITFHDDLQYWGIDELFLDPCCALKYYPERETCQKEMEGEKQHKEKEMRRKMEEDFGNSWIGRARKFCWNLTEYPETSISARVRFRRFCPK